MSYKDMPSENLNYVKILNRNSHFVENLLSNSH